jgi:ribonuclease-3
MTLRDKRLMELQDEIGYSVNCVELFNTALTHSSYANESKGKFQHNERLEFLGDSILSLIVSEYLFQKFPEVSEGNLTKLRSSVVSERSLVNMALSIDLGKYILLGKGEEGTGGRKRASILADAFESLIAAIYLDGGIEKAKVFVLKYIKEHIEKGLNGKGFRDYKTELQELLQQESDMDIEYRIIEEYGPDHDKAFIAEVYYGGEAIGSGFGKSKKEAEQQAACSGLNAKRL